MQKPFGFKCKMTKTQKEPDKTNEKEKEPKRARENQKREVLLDKKSMTDN